MAKGWSAPVAGVRIFEQFKSRAESRGSIEARWVYRPFVPAPAEPRRDLPAGRDLASGPAIELTEPVDRRTIAQG
jgi:hypothetical protein